MKKALVAALSLSVLLSCATTETTTDKESVQGAGAGERAQTLTVSCKKMGGDVHFRVELQSADLVVTVTYPKSIGEYLGGFGESGAKNYSADIAVHLDTDADPETGLKADTFFEAGAGGSEYSIEAHEITTSLGRDAQGQWINGPMLLLDVKKEREYFERPEGVMLRWEVETKGRFRPTDWVKPPESKAMQMRIPAALLGLKAGAKIRVTSVVPLCNDAQPFAGISEAAFVLQDKGPAPVPEPDDEDLTAQGIALLERGGDHETVISLFTKAIELNPKNADAHFNRGYLYELYGKHDQALSDYSAVIETNPRREFTHMLRGYVYERKGEYDKALADYSQEIEVNPSEVRTYLFRGSLYYCLGSFKEAAQDYRKIIAHAGEDEHARLMLLVALMKTSKDEYKKALAEHRKFVTSHSSDTWIRRVSEYYLGMGGIDEKKVLKSAGDGQEGETSAKNLCVAHYFLAEKRLMQGKRKGAQEFFGKCVEAEVGPDEICHIHAKAMLKLMKERKL